jgi:hypothetical protein
MHVTEEAARRYNRIQHVAHVILLTKRNNNAYTHLCPTLTKLLRLLVCVPPLPLLLDVVVVVLTVAALYSKDSSSAPSAL